MPLLRLIVNPSHVVISLSAHHTVKFSDGQESYWAPQFAESDSIVGSRRSYLLLWLWGATTTPNLPVFACYVSDPKISTGVWYLLRMYLLCLLYTCIDVPSPRRRDSLLFFSWNTNYRSSWVKAACHTIAYSVAIHNNSIVSTVIRTPAGVPQILFHHAKKAEQDFFSFLFHFYSILFHFLHEKQFETRGYLLVCNF